MTVYMIELGKKYLEMSVRYRSLFDVSSRYYFLTELGRHECTLRFKMCLKMFLL